MQAMEKRLTKGEDGKESPLTGTETSATILASDFLLEHLNALESAPPKRDIPENAMAKFTQEKVTEEDEFDVLFGGGGIPMSSDAYENLNAGMDPRNFEGKYRK
jgi:hypothetical protein